MTRNELKRFQGILTARHAELEDTVRDREALASPARQPAGPGPDCEEHISLKRLAAVPWTGSCIVCQQTADRNSLELWNAIEGASAFEGPLMHAA